MPNQFDKLFGPTPDHPTPVNPKGLPAGQVPPNVSHTYSNWPFISANPKSVLPRIRSDNRPLGS
jgi:hypothetical protein